MQAAKPRRGWASASQLCRAWWEPEPTQPDRLRHIAAAAQPQEEERKRGQRRGKASRSAGGRAAEEKLSSGKGRQIDHDDVGTVNSPSMIRVWSGLGPTQPNRLRHLAAAPLSVAKGLDAESRMERLAVGPDMTACHQRTPLIPSTELSRHSKYLTTAINYMTMANIDLD